MDPVGVEDEPMPNGIVNKEHLIGGLQLLGQCRNSVRSVLHLWSRQLPSGMLDGHCRAMVAPDHLLFQGFTKRLVTETFQLLSVSQRIRVGMYLRNALARSHPPSTEIYNSKRDSIVSVGISEWAETITVLSTVLRRTLRSASATARLSVAAVALRVSLEVIHSFTRLICGVYFYPRVELDGKAACEGRVTPGDWQRMAESFFELMRKECLRSDLREFGFYLEVPNLHRLRELMDHVIPALLHVESAQEVLFENAHQPLKNSVVNGNGHDDAARAMTRFVESELVSRMRLDAAFFSIPESWQHHAGVRACLLHARPLFGCENQIAWSCSGSSLDACHVPGDALRLASTRCAVQ